MSLPSGATLCGSKLVLISLEVYEDAKFQNWGQVVDYVPRYTCIPSSTDDIQHIVKFAKAHDMSVRAAGFREYSPFSLPSGTIH